MIEYINGKVSQRWRGSRCNVRLSNLLISFLLQHTKNCICWYPCSHFFIDILTVGHTRYSSYQNRDRCRRYPTTFARWREKQANSLYISLTHIFLRSSVNLILWKTRHKDKAALYSPCTSVHVDWKNKVSKYIPLFKVTSTYFCKLALSNYLVIHGNASLIRPHLVSAFALEHSAVPQEAVHSAAKKR